MSSPAIASLRERVEGKWQIPTLFVGIVLLLGSVFRLESSREPPSFDDKLTRLSERVQAGYYTTAIDYGRQLLESKGLGLVQRAKIHLWLARANYLRAERNNRTGKSEAQIVRDEYDIAVRMKGELTAQDLLNVGHTHLWTAECATAISYYQQAVEAWDGPALGIRRRIIELAWYKLDYAPADLLPLVDEFITDARDDPAQQHWAIGTRLDLLADLGRNEEALAFVHETEPRFAGTRWEDAHEYLLCLTLYRVGRQDEAERRLRALRNRLPGSEELYARSGWLLGRVVLSDGHPQRPAEALSFFRDVVNSAPDTVYAPASQVGMGEALAALERFEESLNQYRQAVGRLDGFQGSPLLSPEMVRASITVVAEELRRQGRLEAPLQYYELAVGLIDERDIELLSKHLQIVGDLRGALAQSLRTEADELPLEKEGYSEYRKQLLDEARYLFIEAGETFQRLARINTLNEFRSAETTWRAADLFDEAGETRRTISVLGQFARERPDNELVPRVLLRMGQAWQALGEYAEAAEAYRENLRRFPRTPDAGSGLIPLARCYMNIGGESNLELAEKTLVGHILADSPVFTPAAEEFRDALFLLGELYISQWRFERGIERLEEALERYPDDSRVLQARSLLASAYRRSALALKEDIKKTEKASQWPRMRAEMQRRFKRAAELFAELVRGFEEAGEHNLDARQEPVLKQSRLYQADCLYELGQYRRAVALYETATWIYRGEPSALGAYIQVINCRLCLGQREEARAALRRAQYLLRIMPEHVFEGDYVGQSRKEWERVFAWVETTKLLEQER
ncbi:MAG: tetratricopeptide repeat protein [Phycisphaerae bacterium]|nr:tetratricopeptide repeat protein [Phycisphaerae bacterium]